MKVRHWRAIVGQAIAVSLFAPSMAIAQSHYGQPIYPGYQGFLDNPDGSVTMVFQYFSHGRDSVTIPVGPQNRFTGVEDRNQPTTFLPGNHEFVCVLIVESRQAAEELRWTVAFPQAESATSLDPLNREYMLVERSQERTVRDLDIENAPRGVCLNKAPLVRTNARRFFGVGDSDSVEEVEARLGEDLELNGSAQDEGLPRGSTVAVEWRKVSGPGDVGFGSPDEVKTTARFGATGAYELELHATDGELESAARIVVRVGEADA